MTRIILTWLAVVGLTYGQHPIDSIEANPPDGLVLGLTCAEGRGFRDWSRWNRTGTHVGAPVWARSGGNSLQYTDNNNTKLQFASGSGFPSSVAHSQVWWWMYYGGASPGVGGGAWYFGGGAYEDRCHCTCDSRGVGVVQVRADLKDGFYSYGAVGVATNLWCTIGDWRQMAGYAVTGGANGKAFFRNMETGNGVWATSTKTTHTVGTYYIGDSKSGGIDYGYRRIKYALWFNRALSAVQIREYNQMREAMQLARVK